MEQLKKLSPEQRERYDNYVKSLYTNAPLPSSDQGGHTETTDNLRMDIMMQLTMLQATLNKFLLEEPKDADFYPAYKNDKDLMKEFVDGIVERHQRISRNIESIPEDVPELKEPVPQEEIEQLLHTAEQKRDNIYQQLENILINKQ